MVTPVIDRARPGGRGTLVGVNELDDLIPSWLTLPDVARVLDVEVSRVRRLIDEGELVAVRRGDPVVRLSLIHI